ncbi:MAG: LamG domain-containing protein [Planctomycetota bacterium]
MQPIASVETPVTLGGSILGLPDGPAVTRAIKASNEFTVELLLTPLNGEQNGPARILTISESATDRNFTIGHGTFGGSSRAIEVRCRTTETSSNGQPALVTQGDYITGEQLHVAVIFKDSTLTLWIDGSIVVERELGGDLSNWDEGFDLLLGNEADGGRPWLGTIERARIYDVALSDEEVRSLAVTGELEEPAPEPEPEPTPDPVEVVGGFLFEKVRGDRRISGIAGQIDSFEARYFDYIIAADYGSFGESRKWVVESSEPWLFVRHKAEIKLGESSDFSAMIFPEPAEALPPGEHIAQITVTDTESGLPVDRVRIILDLAEAVEGSEPEPADITVEPSQIELEAMEGGVLSSRFESLVVSNNEDREVLARVESTAPWALLSPDTVRLMARGATVVGVLFDEAALVSRDPGRYEARITVEEVR